MSKLQSQVISFMQLFNQKIEPVPTIPEAGVVRLRVMLVVEEALELLEACFGQVPEKLLIEELVRNTMNAREPKVDLAAVADALGDLDYVSEGARLAFGIEGESVADAIHASNLEKVGGKVLEGGKVGKPKQWTPPDIEGILFKQNSGELPTVQSKMLHYLEPCPQCQKPVGWETVTIDTVDVSTEFCSEACAQAFIREAKAEGGEQAN